MPAALEIAQMLLDQFLRMAAVSMAAAAGPAWAGSAVDIDARLSQKILRADTTQKVYLRIAIRGRRDGEAGGRSPVNVALVVDRSGSMGGDKIVKAREAAIMAVDRLTGTDFGSVVMFDHQVDVLVPAQRVSNHDVFRSRIAEITSRGQTAIHAAVEEAAREIARNKRAGTLNRIILMSDGLANVGPREPIDFERLGQRLGGQGITVTTIGLGNGYNEDLMSRLASASDGNHAFARTAGDLTRIFNQEFNDVLSVTAHDIEVIIETRAGVRPLRSLGRASEIDGHRVKLRVAQAYGTADYSLQVELEVPAGIANGEREIADVRVSYVRPDHPGREERRTQVTARFSKLDSEARASVDPVVMAPIIELETRERTRAAVELRDKGRIEEARKAFEADAAANRAARTLYKLEAKDSVRLEQLERSSREAAAQVADRDKWTSQRKLQRQLQGNSASPALPASADSYRSQKF